MGGYLNKIGLHGHPFDTDVRVLKEPRTVPYNRIGSLERIRTVSVPYLVDRHRGRCGSARATEIVGLLSHINAFLLFETHRLIVSLALMRR